MIIRNARRHVYQVALFCLVLAALTVASAIANPPSWSSFKDASFTDIYLNQPLATNQVDYVLSLGANPQITINGVTYKVNWIQSYFVVGETQETSFIASNGTLVTDWPWEEQPNPGRIAGWVTTGNSRIYANESKQLQFKELNINGAKVLSGMHIGYQVGKDPKTDWFKGTLKQVPEPSSLAALICGACGLAWWRRK